MIGVIADDLTGAEEIGVNGIVVSIGRQTPNPFWGVR
jgi:uncharacterized protein YgbK (DUF1537 family)